MILFCDVVLPYRSPSRTASAASAWRTWRRSTAVFLGRVEGFPLVNAENMGKFNHYTIGYVYTIYIYAKYVL